MLGCGGSLLDAAPPFHSIPWQTQLAVTDLAAPRPPSPLVSPAAAFAGYAVYDVQGARSGLLPVSYLDNGEDDFTKCIGLFAYYNQANPGGNPAVNATLTGLGYNVS